MGDFPHLAILTKRISELDGDQTMHDEGHALTLLELVEGTVYKPSLRTIREKGKDMFTGVLSREYEIRADNYNIGSNAISVFHPVDLLLSQPRVWEIIKMFRFFRFQAIEVRCLVRSLPQQQGFFLVGLYPCKVDGSNTYCDALAPTDPIVLPITDQSSASIRAEWLSPMDWGLINDPNDSGSVSQLGSISDMWVIRAANVIADKTDSSVSSVVTIRWYARFVDPEVNIPTSIYTAPVEAQASTLLDVTSTVGTFVGGTIMSEGTKMVKDYITGSVKGVFDSIIEDDSPEPDTTQQAGFTLSAFGQTAYSSRKQAGQSLSLFPDKRLLRPERYGDKTMEHKIRDIIKTPQLEYIGVVTDISAPLKFVCRPSSHEIGEGANNLSRGYLAYMSQFFRFWRGSIKYHFSFTISSLNSARVYIRLDTSKMVPGTYAQMVSDSPCEVITVKGTVFKTLVVPFISSAPREPTCKPDTIAGISTLYEQYWPKLYVCAEATGSGDRTPTVSCILHCTAGDDFVFESYQSAVSGPFAPEVTKRRKTVQAQSRVSEMDKINETFQGVLVPTAVPWDLTIEHLISRWSDARKTEDATFPFIDRRVESRRLAFTNNFDLLAGNFLFNAGSVRHKIAAPSSFTGVCSVEKQVVRWQELPMTNSQRPDAGVVATDAQEWSIMDFQSPLFNYMDVYTMEEGASSRLLFNNEITAESNPLNFEVAMHWFKAGVNFQLFCLLPVMKRTDWPLVKLE